MNSKFKYVGDVRLALHPLKEVGAEIVAEMESMGAANCCGVCGKPFNAARRWHGLARLTYGGDHIVRFAWKLCRKCTRESKKNGGRVPEALRLEAEQYCADLALAMADAKGTA